MIAILLFAAVLAGGLALLLARFGAPLALGRRRRSGTLDARPTLPEAELRSLAAELLGALGLSLLEDDSDEGFVLRAALGVGPIDGSRLRSLIARHLPSRLSDVDRYSGFGSDSKQQVLSTP